MKQRGRRSVASLTAVVVGDFGKRPEPPPGLTDRQADIWRAAVSVEPPEFFASGVQRDLLADYCRHREMAEKLARAIDACDEQTLQTPEGVKRYAELLKLREVETRTALALATKMRLTNSSRYCEKTALGATRRATPKGQVPWDE